MMSHSVNRNVISNNLIHGFVDGVRWGWDSYPSPSAVDNVFHNNMIYDSETGFDQDGSGTLVMTNTQYYFNSVYAERPIYLDYATTANIRNNIFFCSGTTGAGDSAVNIENSTGVTSDYNDLWAPNGYIGYWNGTPQATLAGWRTASGGDANSISRNPSFVSSTDLHINSSSWCVDAGVVVTGSQYQYDIDGEVRDGYVDRGTDPDMGADENGGGTPLFVDFVLFEAEAQARTILLTWTTAEEIDTAGFTLWRRVAGIGDFEPITADLIPSQGGPLSGATYNYLDQTVSGGQTYEYELEALDIYGGSQTEGPVSVTLEAVCGATAQGTHGGLLLALLLLSMPVFIVSTVKRR